MAGRVKIAPATTAPEHPPMLWIITFWASESFFLSAPVRPTAMIAMGMAASNTWPTLRPRYAAAALNRITIRTPTATEYGVTSEYFLFGSRSGLYTSPGFSSRCAFSGSCMFFFSSIQQI